MYIANFYLKTVRNMAGDFSTLDANPTTKSTKVLVDNPSTFRRQHHEIRQFPSASHHGPLVHLAVE